MFCYKCGVQLNDNDIYCLKCGCRQNQAESVQNNLQFSPNNSQISPLTNQYGTVVRRKNNSAVVAVLVSVCVLFVFIGILFFSYSGGQNVKVDVVGKWSTDEGLDSSIVDFKSDGRLIYKKNIVTVSTSKYSISSNNELTVGTHTYVFSANAKNNDRYSWYLEGDILYFDGQVFYKKQVDSPYK